MKHSRRWSLDVASLHATASGWCPAGHKKAANQHDTLLDEIRHVLSFVAVAGRLQRHAKRSVVCIAHRERHFPGRKPTSTARHDAGRHRHRRWRTRATTSSKVLSETSERPSLSPPTEAPARAHRARELYRCPNSSQLVLDSWRPPRTEGSDASLTAPPLCDGDKPDRCRSRRVPNDLPAAARVSRWRRTADASAEAFRRSSRFGRASLPTLGKQPGTNAWGRRPELLESGKQLSARSCHPGLLPPSPFPVPATGAGPRRRALPGYIRADPRLRASVFFRSIASWWVGSLGSPARFRPLFRLRSLSGFAMQRFSSLARLAARPATVHALEAAVLVSRKIMARAKQRFTPAIRRVRGRSRDRAGSLSRGGGGSEGRPRKGTVATRARWGGVSGGAAKRWAESSTVGHLWSRRPG